MVNATAAATAGLLSSANQATTAAQKILAATKPPSPDFAAEATNLALGNAAYRQAAGNAATPPRSLRSYGGRLNTATQAPAGRNDEDASPSLEEAALNLKTAATAYRANAAVLKSVNRTLGSLLEISS